VFVLTTQDAPRGQLLRLPLHEDGTPAAAAHTVVAQGENPLGGVSRVGEHFVLHYLEDAHSLIEVVDLDGKKRGRVSLPGVGSANGFDGRARSPTTFYSFTNPVTPPSIYRLDARTLASSLVFRPKLPEGPHKLVTDQVFVHSPDGTRLTLFVSHRRDLPLDGSHRLRLYGYGGFNLLTSIGFSPTQWLWMQRGGVYVSAVIRGGGEYGDAWHEAGMLAHKQNVFDDFMAAARYLVDRGYTTPKRLSIEGSSNGGLLTAACLTQQPQLFGAVVVNAGVLDMLRYERFTCGKDWASEYGSVVDIDAYRTLRRYSPLLQVKSGTAYPATLIITGDHDDRVVPAHSFKFAATLQAAQSGLPPVLLRVLPSTGHGAGRSRQQRLEVAADMLAFFEENLR
jgi:prolyl oligopeptidase